MNTLFRERMDSSRILVLTFCFALLLSIVVFPLKAQLADLSSCTFDDLPKSVLVNRQFSINMTLLNKSTMTWNNAFMTTNDLTWGGAKKWQIGTMKPGPLNVTVGGPLISPRTPGTYPLRFQVTSQNGSPLGPTCSAMLTVVTASSSSSSSTSPSSSVSSSSVSSSSSSTSRSSSSHSSLSGVSTCTYVPLPKSVLVNSQFTVNMTIRNNSKYDWNNVIMTSLDRHWGSKQLPAGTLKPGNLTLTVGGSVTAPKTPGTYPMKWQVTTQNGSHIGPTCSTTLKVIKASSSSRKP